jgi:hypothetical protein
VRMAEAYSCFLADDACFSAVFARLTPVPIDNITSAFMRLQEVNSWFYRVSCHVNTDGLISSSSSRSSVRPLHARLRM